jgi:oxygen-dependent protoporphyrinogen oxidase
MAVDREPDADEIAVTGMRFRREITIGRRSGKVVVMDDVSTAPDGSPVRRRPRVAVVGAGIAGLAAAHALAADGRVDVVVYEGGAVAGGKLRRGEVAGVTTDVGAEALLARRPEAVELMAEVGLSDEIVHPVTIRAGVWSRGAIRPLPVGHVMGVPTSVRALAASGVVSRQAVARAALDRLLPATPVAGDTSVGAYVGRRLGPAVVDRLVEPLLGGVYAGRASELSLSATLPQVARAAGRGSLLKALAGSGGQPVGAAAGASRPVGSAGGGAAPPPVFAGLRGGVGRLAEALVSDLAARGVDVRYEAPVRALTRTDAGWRLSVGSAAGRVDAADPADAVVVAVPAAPAARLLADAAPAAAADLAAIEYASMAVLTFAFAASAVDVSLPGSGFLVPAVERRLVKAATFSSAKWGWFPDDVVMLRCSIGRHGDVAELQRDDADLLAGARRDLAAITGIRAAPLDAVVTRWGGALPQYAVGHLDRVARIRAAVEAVPGLAVCGAAYDGVGIPACIATARSAAARVLATLFGEGQ